MITKSKMVFFNIAYMEKYQGHWDVDVPVNGGAFIKLNGWGGEAFNFQPYEGMMYGYVEPGLIQKSGRQRNINISRLTGPGEVKPEPYISGILIIWVARPPKKDESVMVGWYENAILYRKCQQLLEDKQRILPNRSYDYFASAKESDCHLIPARERTLTIPRGAGAFGRSNIWYADSTLGEEIKEKVIDFIKKWKLSRTISATFGEGDSMPTYSKSDIQRMVDQAVGESRHKVNLAAKQILVNTGLEGRQHLQEQYQRRRITEIEIQRGLTTLLHAAMEIAKNKKREEIDESDIIEAMRSKCPIKPWC